MNAENKRFEADPKSEPLLLTSEHTEPSPELVKKSRRSRFLMLSLPILLLAGGVGYWASAGRYITTDNAYIHQPMIAISADVSGRVTQVNVDENQFVDTGMPLFNIDPEPFRISLDRAEATLAAARQEVVQLRANYATAKAQLDAARGILEVRNRELDRQKDLTAHGVATVAKLDEAMLAARSARNTVTVAERQLEAAAAALGGNPAIETDALPSVRAALAARDTAKRDHESTQVQAPSAGVVSQVESLNVGQFLPAGTQIATLVGSGNSWIEANFKETQLDGIEIGLPVEIKVDAFPDIALRGTVGSIGSATGSQFSLIPAQNATGNWVKVVQRLSVRIEIEDARSIQLRDGMSVHVAVDTGHSNLDKLR